MQGLPSPPSDSPQPLNPTDSSAISRKRQRSQSMESNTSSTSTKRTVADGASNESGFRSPRTEQLSTLSISDTGIDAYMKEQGTEDMDILILTPSADQPQPLFSAVSPQEKLSIIERLKDMPMSAGETWFIVDAQWLKRWKKACTGEVDKEGPVSEQELGPVDNSSLIDEYGHLKTSLSTAVDMQFVPEEAWTHLVSWYGPSSISLPRKAIERGASREVQLELHPPRLRVLRMTKNVTIPSSDGPSCPNVIVSSQDTLKTVCQRLTHAVAGEPEADMPEYRVWKVEPSNQEFDAPEFSVIHMPASSPSLLTPSDRQTVDDERIQSTDAFVVEFRENGQWLYDSPDRPVFDSNDGFFNRKSTSTSSFGGLFGPFGKTTYSGLTNGRSSPPSSKTLVPGTLGLGNMGNTCFMNSALQCLAHNKELTDYFLSGVFQEELNPDNPLGMQGAIAEAYGALIDRIWATSGPSTSYSPRDFKSALQRFAPQFHGYQQHDSQELVAFLLDGLHEDLNRVLKKPYVEKPDWEGGGELELIQLARTSWEGYMKRNDSVIVDLFQGQYQSTLVCPECQKVSITFDPFMYLTLPLPVRKKWKHDVYYIPWDPAQDHVKVPVEVGRDASFKDVRALLGRWMGSNPDNLLTLEIFQNRFYKNLDDTVLCGEMGDNDTIVCYELPCHARQNKSYKKSPDDPVIIPIHLADQKVTSVRSYGTYDRPTHFGYPYIAVIPREQARSKDDIYAAIVESLSRWTVHSKDLYHLEGDRPPNTGLTNGEPISDSVPEIDENGDITKVEEGDITEQKVANDDTADDMEEVISIKASPSKPQVKADLFEMKIRTELSEVSSVYMSSGRWDSWQNRINAAEDKGVLLGENDMLFLEFDEHIKAFYFGEEKNHYEHARWTQWKTFLHPEYEASQKADSEKQSKGISLQDCLDEFTKEEQLGQDDLWYCPACKKHQQATKRFDLWKVPDILVVHLKRFSSSRTLRDKIDVLVDFPVEGLDISDMVGERKVLKKLLANGVALDDARNLDEPLIYDLFAVDEHLGGLGGGHYRAYALNHLDNKWYHFDDSFVTPAQAADAVNSNAYLLFYRRRSSSPLGGKSHIKTEEARHKPKTTSLSSTSQDTQLPTPPNEPTHAIPRQITHPSTEWSSQQEMVDSLRRHEELGLIRGPLDDSIDLEGPYSFSPRRRRRASSITSSNEADGFASDQDLEMDDWHSLRDASPHDSWSSDIPEDVDPFAEPPQAEDDSKVRLRSDKT